MNDKLSATELVWLVFNADAFEPVAAYLDEDSAEQAAVNEHNRLYGHNEDWEDASSYEDVQDFDGKITIIGPAPLRG